jgi:beta-phosphoglucomutase-like phosphatase (HAD superfamily)
LIKHVLFDNDGTLVDSEIIFVRAILHHLHRFGLEIDEQTYCVRYPGLRERDIIARLRQDFNADLPDDILTEVRAEYRETFSTQLRSIQGMPGLFRKVKVPRSVVSNGSVRHVEKSLKRVRLHSALNGQIFSAEQVDNPKPFPDVYHFALEKLQLEPGQTVVIEDSPTGVKAAKDAGLEVIGFLGAAHIHDGHEAHLKNLGADHIARDAKALGILLEKWNLLQ